MAPAPPLDGLTASFVEVDGVRLHVHVGGDPDGPPVLLWHGFLGTAHVWRKVAPALAAAGCAVLVPDMRGHGDSDKPPGEDGYDGRALAEECRAVAAQLGFGGGRPLTLVAHDMGALPALLWAADHPEEVATLFYLEAPVALESILRELIVFTPDAMAHGSLWWWVLPHAPGVAERLVVGKERAFLTWFYDSFTVDRAAIDAAAVDEYLRTFAGEEGVLGAMGPYRAIFATMEQTGRLVADPVRVPVVALGGDAAQGAHVRAMVERVASDVRGGTLPGVGHFLPEECPDELVARVLEATR